MIIGLVGEKLTGKDTVANYLLRKYGADHMRVSHILDELLNVLGLPITRRNEIDAGLAMEKTFGPKVIGQALLGRIKKSHAPMVVYNGVRQPYQFEDVKSLGGAVIYITAPAEARFDRMVQRGEKADDSAYTFEQFIKQDKEWIEADIPKLGSKADFTIQNDGTVEDLYAKVDTIMESLKR